MKILLYVVIAFLGLELQAQNATVSSGGDMSSSNGSVSYTIGQVSYSYNSGSNGNITEGVQQIEIESTSSLNESQYDLDFNLYPNPASDHIIVESSAVNDFENVNYSIYDNEGKEVINGLFSSTTTLVNISELPKSTYYLKVTVENQIIETFKIVKN